MMLKCITFNAGDSLSYYKFVRRNDAGKILRNLLFDDDTH